jgi:hypothetical protein
MQPLQRLERWARRRRSTDAGTLPHRPTPIRGHVPYMRPACRTSNYDVSVPRSHFSEDGYAAANAVPSSRHNLLIGTVNAVCNLSPEGPAGRASARHGDSCAGCRHPIHGHVTTHGQWRLRAALTLVFRPARPSGSCLRQKLKAALLEADPDFSPSQDAQQTTEAHQS